jgi:excisionase family DNA binding protein
MQDADDNLTVAEVAPTLKLNQQTVRNWIDAGLLPVLHGGRRVRTRREGFDQLVSESYSGAAETAKRRPEYNIWDGQIPPPQMSSIRPGLSES